MVLSLLVTAYFWLFLGIWLGVVTVATVETVVHGGGRYRDFSLIESWLASLLRRGYDGGYLRVVHEESGRFLHFRKYIRGKGDYGLEFRGPGSDWPERTWRKAQAVADDAGLAHRVEPSKFGDRIENVLVIDCGRDTAIAYDIATSIWTEAFGLTLGTPYKAIGDGKSVVDELIDGPDHPPPLHSLPSEDQLKELDTRRRKLGGPSNRTVFGSAIVFTLILISGIGFPIAMLLSRGEAPDWSVDLGVVSLAGSTAGLVFLAIYLASRWAKRRLDWRKTKPPMKPWHKHLRIFGRGMGIALPFAVILAWTGF